MPQKEDNKHIEILQKMPISNKLTSAFELYDFARSRIAGEMKRQNPKITPTELNKLIQKRFSSR